MRLDLMSLLIRGSQWQALKGAIIFLSFFLPGSRTLRPFGVIQHSVSTDIMMMGGEGGVHVRIHGGLSRGCGGDMVGRLPQVPY